MDRWAVIHHHFDERSFNVWEMNKIFLFASVAVFLSFHRLNETSRNIYFAGEKKRKLNSSKEVEMVNRSINVALPYVNRRSSG